MCSPPCHPRFEEDQMPFTIKGKTAVYDDFEFIYKYSWNICWQIIADTTELVHCLKDMWELVHAKLGHGVFFFFSSFLLCGLLESLSKSSEAWAQVIVQVCLNLQLDSKRIIFMPWSQQKLLHNKCWQPIPMHVQCLCG